MARVYEGNFDGRGMRIGLVVSRFNDMVTGHLLDGALDRLRRLGVADDAIEIIRVPGAFEVPIAVKRMAEGKQVDGIVALAAVIRGATPHFDVISGEIGKSLANLNLNQSVPISFGVLTTDTLDQALERAGSKQGNKGSEAAETLVEMINVLKDFSGQTNASQSA